MSADDAIVLTTDPTLGREAYTLAVKPQRIEITGGDYGGVFNGIQALLRLLPPPRLLRQGVPAARRSRLHANRRRPALRVPGHDAGRGPHLDRSGLELKRYIDLLSYHGINKLHLHLSDDEGWRIEIRSHPELTEIGGFRGGDSPVRPVYGKWDEKYGGFYTQDEMRGLIRYAAVRNIEIHPRDRPARAQPQHRLGTPRNPLQLPAGHAVDQRLRLPFGMVRGTRGELRAARGHPGRASARCSPRNTSTWAATRST